MDKFSLINGKTFDELPKTSGVYSFYEKNKIIYIGKAINIKGRVKNHFQQPSYRDDLFIDKVDKIGYLETNSEIEALILEANLIKKYQPKFNVVWRDDKNYFYVAITKNETEIPYVYVTHQPFGAAQGRKSQKAEYIGPFVEGTALKKTLRFLRRAFPYYISKKHPKNKCTYCHMGLCPGPYEELIGPSTSLRASSKLSEYKKNIKKLVLILKGKKTAALSSLRKDMKDLSKKKKYEEAAKIRDRIFNLQQVMSHTRVIEQNSKPFGTEQNHGWQKTQKILQGLAGIDKEITKIECYDVSNIQGKFATGSMVAFVEGKPAANQYKKFKIRIENTPNDIAMLKEILERRLSHKEWQYPEIMLIDGGIAQLNVAIRVKGKLPIKILSLAKRNKDLYIEGRNGSTPLKNLPREIYNLILQLDDEAHRFAISYHKKLRKNDLFK